MNAREFIAHIGDCLGYCQEEFNSRLRSPLDALRLWDYAQKTGLDLIDVDNWWSQDHTESEEEYDAKHYIAAIGYDPYDEDGEYPEFTTSGLPQALESAKKD